VRRTTVQAGVAVVAASVMLAGSCGSTADPPLGITLPTRLVANLETFEGCDELTSYFEDVVPDAPGGVVGDGVAAGGVVANEVAGSAGSGSQGVVRQSAAGDAVAVAESSGGGPAASGAPDANFSATAAEDFSRTNVQEAGVDEPDLVKTDGRLVVAVAQGRLHVVGVEGRRRLGSVALPEGSHELFLVGDRAVVLTSSWGVPIPAVEDVASVGGDAVIGIPEIMPATGSTVVSAVDLADPSNPRVVESATFEGRYVSARLADGVIRLVLASYPTPVPEGEGTPPGGAEASAFLPDRVVEGEGGVVEVEPLVACDAVARPADPAGPGTTTVLTFEADGGLEPIDSDAVVADTQTVYASAEGLYVAVGRWNEQGGVATDIHAFDISSPRSTEYVGSGSVAGELLNQWALSDHGGHLRVATTRVDPTNGRTDNGVTVLRRDRDRLVAVGQVAGLGEGERIYAVRYFGDLGFVVTFRQVDPLYALDFSDPANPRLRGELKVPGFSTYLHPVGEGRLLGVGQDADEAGRTRGTQVSLFDVSDLANMRRVDQESIPGGSSSVEHDHRAFLWWAASGLAVLPVEVWGSDVRVVTEDDLVDRPATQSFVGAAGFRVSAGGIDPAGRVAHPDHPDPNVGGPVPIQRAFVAGGVLYTLSDAGLMASALDGLGQQAWIQF